MPLTVWAVFGAALVQSGCGAKKPRFQRETPIAQPVIRVKIAGPGEQISLAVTGPFKVQDSAGGFLFGGERLRPERLTLRGEELHFGRRVVIVRDHIDVVPRHSGVLQVDGRAYRGSVRLHRVRGGMLLAINHVGVEDYLRGVLRAELPRRFATETYRAQAVAARTFALYERSSRGGKGRTFDVHATEASQVYHGMAAETDKGDKAVARTRGIVLTGKTGRGWKVFPTFFSSTCGGWTQPGRYLAAIDPQFEPLQGDVRCSTCRDSPYFRWRERRVSLQDVAVAVNRRLGTSFKHIVKIAAAATSRHGRITKVRVTDRGGERVDVAGEKFRLVVGSRKMASTCCKIRRDGKELVFYDGKGLGHGVGMCQYGAEGMARRGRTAIEILKHYYPGGKLVRVY